MISTPDWTSAIVDAFISYSRSDKAFVVRLLAIAALVAALCCAASPDLARAADPNRPAERGFAKTESGQELRERESWFFRQRAYPRTSIPKGALSRATAQARPLRRLSGSPFGPLRAPGLGSTSAPAGAEGRFPGVPAGLPPINWTGLGPNQIGRPGDPSAPWSGHVTSIATDPADPKTVYVGGATGGVWKTIDAGAHWLPLFDAQRAPEVVSALVLDPNDHRTLYVGTGGPEGYGGTGLYKSRDGGATWTLRQGLPSEGCSVSAVAVKPSDSNTVVATVAGQVRGGAGCATGIYRSLDGGTTWSRVLPGGNPVDVEISPADDSIWFAGFDGFGIWRSVDGGSTWRRLAGGLPTENIGNVALDAAPSDGNRLYAIFAPRFGGEDPPVGIWTSRDGGDSWQGPIGRAASDQLGMFGWYALDIAVDPSDPDTFYAGDVVLAHFVYAGGDARGDFGSWERMHSDFHALAFDATGRLWIGTDGGVYRASDGLATISNRNGDLSLTQFEPGTSGSPETRIVGGTQDNGAISRGRGGNWSGFGPPCDGGYTASDPKSTSLIYFTSQKAGCRETYLYKSADGGASFAASGDGVDLAESAEFYPPLRMSPGDRTRLYTGRRNLWESTDSGGSWHALTNTPLASTISAIGSGKSPATIYVGTSGWGAPGSELQVTTDGGSTWVDTAPHGLPNAYVTSVTVNPDDAAVAYASVSGFGTGHVFKTINSGLTWVDVSGNLPAAVPVNAVAVDWRTNPATAYLATDVGVFWSVDEGATWQDTSDGMPPTVVMDIRIDAATGKLLAATHGRGMFTAPLPRTASG